MIALRALIVAAAALIAAATTVTVTSAVSAIDQVVPRGTRSLLTVWDTGHELTRPELREAIVRSAREHHVDLAKDVERVRARRTERTLYVLYRSDAHAFDRARTDTAHSHITTVDADRPLPLVSLNGTYVSDGPERAVGRVAADLRAHGVEVTTRPVDLTRTLPEALAAPGVVPIASVTLGAGAVLGICVVAVRSRRTSWSLTVLGGASAVVTLFTATLLSSAATAASDAARTVDRSTSEQARWRHLPERFGLSYSADPEELDASLPEVGKVIRSRIATGRALVVAGRNDSTGGFGPDAGRSLTSTRALLREQCLRSPAGRCVRSGHLDTDALTLLVPEEISAATLSSIRSEWEDWAEFQHSEREEELGEAAPRMPVSIVRVASGQRVFDSRTAPGEVSSSVVDPVIALLPSEPVSVSNNWLVSKSTSWEVVFDDGTGLRRTLHDSGLEHLVDGVVSVRHRADARLRSQEHEAAAERDATVLTATSTVLGASATTILLLAALRRRRDRSPGRF